MSERSGGGRIWGVASALWSDPRALKAIGTVALIGALVVAVAPGLLDGLSFVRVVGWEWLIAPVGVVAVVLAIQAFRTGDDDDAELPPPDYEDREPADAPRVGRAIDEHVEALVGDDASVNRDGAVDEVWRHLRETAVETMVDVEGMDRETASARIGDGTWTEDPRAAAFLGGEAAPPLPVWLRIADFLRGAPAARRIEATVEAIQRHAEVERAGPAGPTLDPVESSADESDPEVDASIEELEAFLEQAESRAATDGGESR